MDSPPCFEQFLTFLSRPEQGMENLLAEYSLRQCAADPFTVPVDFLELVNYEPNLALFILDKAGRGLVMLPPCPLDTL